MVGHVVADVVFQRKWLRSPAVEHKVNFDTGAVVMNTVESVFIWVDNPEPADTEAEVLTDIVNDRCISALYAPR